MVEGVLLLVLLLIGTQSREDSMTGGAAARGEPAGLRRRWRGKLARRGAPMTRTCFRGSPAAAHPSASAASKEHVSRWLEPLVVGLLLLQPDASCGMRSPIPKSLSEEFLNSLALEPGPAFGF